MFAELGLVDPVGGFEALEQVIGQPSDRTMHGSLAAQVSTKRSSRP